MTTTGARFTTPDGPAGDGPGCDHPLTRLLLLLEIADQPDWLRDLAAPAGSAPQSLR
ncbi:hypothetical protein [Streptomyces sp. AA1529]|uniref:hypothetical protein n=1 Tax=Streptomyces sp. AA1529 TaxID=1203257 RepID=UPI0003122394|nr:hypothetical protein [Streptomyces sp. AA1529]